MIYMRILMKTFSKKHTFYCFLYAAWIVLLIYNSFPDQQGTDYYPVKVCTENMLKGENIYSEKITALVADNWDVVAKDKTQVPPYCNYPLPFYSVTSFFILMPDTLELSAWFLCFLFLPLLNTLVCIKFTNKPIPHFLPFVFYPLYHASGIKTSSIVWIDLILITILLFEKWIKIKATDKTSKDNLLLIMLSLLSSAVSFKPQVGAFFSLYCIYKILRIGNIRERILCIFFATFIPLITLLISPFWISDWLHTVSLYSSTLQLKHVFDPINGSALLLILMLIFKIKEPFLIITYFHFIVFPSNDIYCANIFVCAFRYFNTKVSLVTAFASWLMPVLLIYPNSEFGLLTFIYIPFFIILFYEQIALWLNAQRYMSLKST
jgi:hypothetical protein